MKIFHMYCQGLGSTLTIQYLTDIRKFSKPDIMLLTETKIGYDAVNKLCKDLNYAHSFVLLADGLSGGLTIFWDVNIELTVGASPSFFTTDVYIADGANIFCLSYIYGHPILKTRNMQWNIIIFEVNAGVYSSRPRLALGDFNDIKYSSEKEEGKTSAPTTWLLFYILKLQSGKEISYFGMIVDGGLMLILRKIFVRLEEEYWRLKSRTLWLTA
ncbi:uncharacterized protein LOC112089875 [Eutrema salsugineum]|uniref:uncharacterized protein LOC112089875 n=1 Tax=Eutrema salsugineum TaxID=72664 RepID=UPI000CED21CD|nr:uncharacterized protein LOC112089875 [Eutrema salsugineum]